MACSRLSAFVDGFAKYELAWRLKNRVSQDHMPADGNNQPRAHEMGRVRHVPLKNRASNRLLAYLSATAVTTGKEYFA
jgi:hypothetical protein